MKIILMRHSTCKGLSQSIINGWKDFSLTEEGIKEAIDTAKHIANYKIDKTYTSYLSRTYDTAKNILQALKIEMGIVQDIRLNERHYGFFQGKTKEEALKYKEYNTLSISADNLDGKLIPITDEQYKEQLEEYSKKLGVNKDNLELPRSESVLDVEKRIKEFLNDEILLEENKDKIILIVGHANTVKLITKEIEGLTFEETSKLRFATCGMKIFDLEYKDENYILNNVENINKEWVG